MRDILLFKSVLLWLPANSLCRSQQGAEPVPVMQYYVPHSRKGV